RLDRSQFPGAAQESFDTESRSFDHFSVSAGAHIDISDAWSLALTGVKGSVRNRSDFDNLTDLSFITASSHDITRDDSGLGSLSAVANGSLFAIGGIVPRAAVGAELRDEDLKQTVNHNDVDYPMPRRSRNVHSAFAELMIPLVEQGAHPALHKLE